MKRLSYGRGQSSLCNALIKDVHVHVHAHVLYVSQLHAPNLLNDSGSDKLMDTGNKSTGLISAQYRSGAAPLGACIPIERPMTMKMIVTNSPQELHTYLSVQSAHSGRGWGQCRRRFSCWVPQGQYRAARACRSCLRSRTSGETWENSPRCSC